MYLQEVSQETKMTAVCSSASENKALLHPHQTSLSRPSHPQGPRLLEGNTSVGRSTPHHPQRPTTRFCLTMFSTLLLFARAFPTLTNFVQFFTANKSYNSLSQSYTTHWWTLKVTKYTYTFCYMCIYT